LLFTFTGDELLNKHRYYQIDKFKKKWATRKVFYTLKTKNKENRVKLYYLLLNKTLNNII